MKIKIPNSDVDTNTLITLLRYRAANQPHALAYRFLTDEGTEETLTYAEFDRKARIIAAQLQRHYQVGDRAVLIYPPGLELITAYFGCLYAGIISVPMYPPTNHKLVTKLELIIKDAQPRVILSTQEVFEKIQKIKEVKLIAKTPVTECLTSEAQVQCAPSWLLDTLPLMTTDKLSCL